MGIVILIVHGTCMFIQNMKRNESSNLWPGAGAEVACLGIGWRLSEADRVWSGLFGFVWELVEGCLGGVLVGWLGAMQHGDCLRLTGVCLGIHRGCLWNIWGLIWGCLGLAVGC